MSRRPFVAAAVVVAVVAEEEAVAAAAGSVQWLRQKRIWVTKNWRVLSKTVAKGLLKTVEKDLSKIVVVVVLIQMVAVHSNVEAVAYPFPYLHSVQLVQRMCLVVEADFQMSLWGLNC